MFHEKYKYCDVILKLRVVEIECLDMSICNYIYNNILLSRVHLHQLSQDVVMSDV